MSPVHYYRPGGRTLAFRDQPFYDKFMKRFRREEVTALWNKGLGMEDIVQGIATATGETESVVTGWLVEQPPRADLARAAGLWAATRWHKEFPRYYVVVGHGMDSAETASGQASAACLVKLMKLEADPEYINAGLSQQFSWRQLVYGVENGIALEYLSAITPGHNDDEEEGDDDGPHF